MPVLHVMERHDQLLDLWRARDAKGLHVVHMDFHCDMRGLLINRKTARAYDINARRSGVDEGNFLAHAILEGRVRRLVWVHDTPGGRNDDAGGTVKYETDPSMVLKAHRLARSGALGVPLDYQVTTMAQWRGPQGFTCLDIDWDVLAAREYPSDTIEARIKALLERVCVEPPQEIALCYSPSYVHPSRERFEQVVARLADVFGARIERAPEPKPTPERRSCYRRALPPGVYRGLVNVKEEATRWLQRRGIR